MVTGIRYWPQPGPQETNGNKPQPRAPGSSIKAADELTGDANPCDLADRQPTIPHIGYPENLVDGHSPPLHPTPLYRGSGTAYRMRGLHDEVLGLFQVHELVGVAPHKAHQVTARQGLWGSALRGSTRTQNRSQKWGKTERGHRSLPTGHANPLRPRPQTNGAHGIIAPSSH